MTPSPKPGRKPSALGETSATRRRVLEVVGIVKRLGGSRREPVRFSQVYPELKAPHGSRNPELWQRVSAWRALDAARREGLLERTPKGYRDLDAVDSMFSGFRYALDHHLSDARLLLEGRPARGDEPRTGFGWGMGEELPAITTSNELEAWSLQFAYELGAWVRAMSDRFRKERPQGFSRTGRRQPADITAIESALMFFDGFTRAEWDEARRRSEADPSDIDVFHFYTGDPKFLRQYLETGEVPEGAASPPRDYRPPSDISLRIERARARAERKFQPTWKRFEHVVSWISREGIARPSSWILFGLRPGAESTRFDAPTRVAHARGRRHAGRSRLRARATENGPLAR